MEKQMWRFGLALALVNLLGATALAEEGCSIFPDMFDEYSLGRIPIGAKAQNYISSEDLKACIEFPCCIRGECNFEENGINYKIWYTATDKPETATVMLASITGETPSPPLIAGLKLGDPLDVVYRKLNSLPDHFPKWHRNDFSGGDLRLSTGPCWRSSVGDLWGYDINFDENGKLNDLSARHEMYEP
jgi:hypothetical protein